MTKKRTSLALETRKRVLHEAGYRCANPACRTVLTIDIHHLDYLCKGGGDSAENLLALCPNCHALHHHGHLPEESLRAWKMVLLALNEGFDRRAIDMLLVLDKYGDNFVVSADGILACAPLIVSGLAETGEGHSCGVLDWKYFLHLTEKGGILVAAWKEGDERAVSKALSQRPNNRVESDN